jgi:hypothetical protein
MWNTTTGLWTSDSRGEFVEWMVFATILFSAPGVLAIVAGLLLRSRRSGHIAPGRVLAPASPP